MSEAPTPDQILEAIWDRTPEAVHQLRLGLDHVYGQSPMPKLYSMQAMALVMASAASGLMIGVEGSDGTDPIPTAKLIGFTELPDLVASLRAAADIFESAYRKGSN